MGTMGHIGLMLVFAISVVGVYLKDTQNLNSFLVFLEPPLVFVTEKIICWLQ